MKTVRLRAPAGIENLEFGSSEGRAPGEGEITVRVRATSLNFHDYLVVTGVLPTPDGRIPMSDGAGEVIAVGEGVSDFKVGDKVVATFFPKWLDGDGGEEVRTDVPGDGADGFAREEVTGPAWGFTPAPRGYTDLEAATIACAGLTAWRSLFVDGGLSPGDTVLLQGTGGVSIFALQFAKAAGAAVIATSSSDEKLERLKAMGADHLINYRKTPDWGDRALEFTGGKGVDKVLEVGGANTLPQSMTATRHGGQISIIGRIAGREAMVSVGLVQFKRLRLQGVSVGSRRDQLQMIRGIEATGVKPVIDSTFPLEDLAAAFRHQESGRHFGKICISI